MIQLSNIDAEKICAHLENRLVFMRESFKCRSEVSTNEFNEARLLGLLINKINRKLDKECPDRHKK